MFHTQAKLGGNQKVLFTIWLSMKSEVEFVFVCACVCADADIC